MKRSRDSQDSSRLGVRGKTSKANYTEGMTQMESQQWLYFISFHDHVENFERTEWRVIHIVETTSVLRSSDTSKPVVKCYWRVIVKLKWGSTCKCDERVYRSVICVCICMHVGVYDACEGVWQHVWVCKVKPI